MTQKKHIKRHKELHKALDELVADWIRHQEYPKSVSLTKLSVMDLMLWSYQQTKNPAELQKDQ